MKIKTIVLSSILAATAVAANAEAIEKEFNAKITDIYAVRKDGSAYNIKDAECKSQFSRFLDQELTGMYKIDADRDAGGATVTFDGHEMMLTPVKVGDAWGFVGADVPAPLTEQNIKEIRVNPPQPNGDDMAHVDIMLQPTPDQFVCVAANHKMKM